MWSVGFRLQNYATKNYPAIFIAEIFLQFFLVSVLNFRHPHHCSVAHRPRPSSVILSEGEREHTVNVWCANGVTASEHFWRTGIVVAVDVELGKDDGRGEEMT